MSDPQKRVTMLFGGKNLHSSHLFNFFLIKAALICQVSTKHSALIRSPVTSHGNFPRNKHRMGLQRFPVGALLFTVHWLRSPVTLISTVQALVPQKVVNSLYGQNWHALMSLKSQCLLVLDEAFLSRHSDFPQSSFANSWGKSKKWTPKGVLQIGHQRALERCCTVSLLFL